MKLSEELQNLHDHGDVGGAVEGLAAQAEILEAALDKCLKLEQAIKSMRDAVYEVEFQDAFDEAKALIV